jgi:male sterility protein
MPQRASNGGNGRAGNAVSVEERGARLLHRLGIRRSAARRIRFVEGDIERPGLGLRAGETSRLCGR